MQNVFGHDKSTASKPSFWILLLAFAIAVCIPPSLAQKADAPALGKIKRASSVAIDCTACPRALAKARETARRELAVWDRFQIVDDPEHADLIFMFSANPYLGDYLTRKGPDLRPVRIESTIMTVIDPRTGQELWTDYRRWGSWRVAGATRELIDELRGQLEIESRKWALDDVLRCSGAAAYQPFAFMSLEEVLAKPELGARSLDTESNRLSVSLPSAPDFCRRGQLVVGVDHRIDGFEVVATESDALDVADVLVHADRFQFASGKDAQTESVYFTAQSPDKKVLIEFEARGRRMSLVRVRYSY